jgi:hypothetical protein
VKTDLRNQSFGVLYNKSVLVLGISLRFLNVSDIKRQKLRKGIHLNSKEYIPLVALLKLKAIKMEEGIFSQQSISLWTNLGSRIPTNSNLGEV